MLSYDNLSLDDILIPSISLDDILILVRSRAREMESALSRRVAVPISTQGEKGSPDFSEKEEEHDLDVGSSPTNGDEGDRMYQAGKESCPTQHPQLQGNELMAGSQEVGLGHP
ncbi:hypothetical protein NDU88_001916 [Pleurodeles waltl]|uniref:Uncharacterized protein n=1 Tax=Pleurodeles waltl TaxID=8319 RepID=A0AAV7WJS3_PLEWA|nr:hypothetical protein NDU88_001916 [Pleurodeles waltl]